MGLGIGWTLQSSFFENCVSPGTSLESFVSRDGIDGNDDYSSHETKSFFVSKTFAPKHFRKKQKFRKRINKVHIGVFTSVFFCWCWCLDIITFRSRIKDIDFFVGKSDIGVSLTTSGDRITTKRHTTSSDDSRHRVFRLGPERLMGPRIVVVAFRGTVGVDPSLTDVGRVGRRVGGLEGSV